MNSTIQLTLTDAELVTLRNGLELIALRMLSNPEAARDAAQETMLRVLTALRDGRVAGSVPVSAFAYGVLRHVVADLHRGAVREHVTDTPPEVEAGGPNALDRLVGEEDARGVRNALDQLSPSDRRLLERCYVDGLRITEIARETGEPAARLRVRKLRALERLRRLLGNETDANATTEK